MPNLQIQIFDPATLRGLSYILGFLLVAPLFPFIYIVARLRSDESHTRGAGTYGALLYFRTASLLVALAGVSNLSYGWVSTSPIEPALDRMSWGMFVGSTVFLVLNMGLLRFLSGERPDRGLMEGQKAPLPHLPDVHRVFSGFLMIMAGLIGFTALVLFFITLFERVGGAAEYIRRVDELKLHAWWIFYYLGTYLVTVVLLAKKD